MAFTKAFTAAELAPGKARCVRLQGKAIAVFNVNGQFYAIDDTCSHAEASLSEGPLVQDDQGHCAVECPWHGARFDVKTGAALSLPAVTPVKSYPVRLNAGSVEVDV